jgi:putative peptidoglycan lipid II flippase
MFNAGALLRGLLRLRVYVPAAGWSRFLVQVCVSCGAMALAIHLLLQRFGDWIALGVAGRITALTVCVVVPMAVFLMACLVVGIRPSRLRAPGPPTAL